MCFQRRSLHDVLLGDHKVAGSAQRRHQGVVLQHGSVLLSRSDQAPELPGIAQLAEQSVAAADLLRAWAERLALRLGLRWVPSVLPAELHPRVEWWHAHRFACSQWTRKR